MYQRILVALDGSPMASMALDTAIDLARAAGATVFPLYVIDLPTMAFDVAYYDPAMIRDAFIEESRRLVADARLRLQNAGVMGEPQIAEVSIAGADGVPGCVVSRAKELKADLIVMGTHGRRGIRRLVLGSVAETVLRSAPCHVLLVRGEALPKAGNDAAEVSHHEAVTTV